MQARPWYDTHIHTLSSHYAACTCLLLNYCYYQLIVVLQAFRKP